MGRMQKDNCIMMSHFFASAQNLDRAFEVVFACPDNDASAHFEKLGAIGKVMKEGWSGKSKITEQSKETKTYKTTNRRKFTLAILHNGSSLCRTVLCLKNHEIEV
eukprot:c13150_g1_i4.p1 GENE.c13150_g1_i4~~c13150_g1_i4.p1  ORF type:complete len:105 (-),score=13.27 c13150_g1_i4:388-702(-)